MAEAQRLIGISLAKIAQSRVCRGGVSLHKNLLVATVLQKARYIFMEEAYHIVHGHYLQQQQQQQQHHHQLMQEQQNAAYLLAGHCDSSSADSCNDDCTGNKCSSEMEEKRQNSQLPTIGGPAAAAATQEDELVDPVEEEEEEEDETSSTVSGAGAGTAAESLSYDSSDSTILPTTIGGLPLEPLNMCRNSGACTTPEEEEEETGAVGDGEDGKEHAVAHDVSHLFLLPALAPWISASEDKENAGGGSFPFLPSSFDSHDDEEEEEDEEEEDEEEEEEEENTCQDLSCHQRKPEVVEQEQTPELVKQFESAVRSKGAMRYFDLDDRRTSVGRPDRRRRRHRTEGDHHHQPHQSTPAKRRRSSTTESSANDMPPPVEDDRILPIALLSAKRLKTCDAPRTTTPLTPAICNGSPGQPQFYSSPHETICPGDAETLSACVNQQLEAENLTTTSGNHPLLPSADQPEQQQPAEESSDVDAPPTPSVESIDRITSLVSIFSFGNLSRSVSTPDFCAAQAQKDSRPDAGGSLLTSQLQHHGQRGYLTMTV
uniref:Uncharacterized protein n=1 Tax=Anopheles stephensi TaxID=30069 RepID=A0A182Y709_ANOST